MSETLYRHKKKNILENEDKFTFGEFLMQLRTAWGSTRKFVSDTTEITRTRLRNLEINDFSECPFEEISKLSDHYGIASSLMFRKAKEVVNFKKNTTMVKTPHKSSLAQKIKMEALRSGEAI